jgi:hypothetical protein
LKSRKTLTIAILSILLFSFFTGLSQPVYGDVTANVNLMSTGAIQQTPTGMVTMVQGNARGTITSGSSITVNLANAPISGNILIATVGVSSYPVHVSRINETGVTWSLVAQKYDRLNNLDCEIWQGIVGSGASASITVTLSASASSKGIVDVCEWSGLSTSSSLDQTATNTFPSPGYGSQYGNTGTAAQTSQPYELCIGAIMSNDAVYPQTNPTNSFTMLDGLQMAYLYCVVGTKGTYSCGTTFLYSSTLWAGCIATFKAASLNPYPLVTLNSPANCTVYAHNPIVFSYTPQYASSARLWMNVSGTWQSVASNSSVTNDALNSISYSMPQNNNTYVWNIEVLNTAGNAFASANWIIKNQPLGSGMALTQDGSTLLNSAGQVVNIRGMGIAGIAPDLLFWTADGSDNWGEQWKPANNSAVTQTLAELSSVWHVNMIRVFIYPEWWWLDNVSPYNASGGNFGVPGQTVSTRNYIKTLAAECASYGIYLDIVPYTLTASANAFSNDPYLDVGGGGNIPMSGEWDATQTAFLASTGLSEADFWTAYWKSMAEALKSYPNVIFEAWNEPSIGTNTNTVPSGFLSYLSVMYNAIRATGSTNLIFMMWWYGWAPNLGQTLGWTGQISRALIPTNIVYNFHLYYYSPSDCTPYWNQNGLDSSSGGIPYTTAQLETILRDQAIGTMGTTAPLVSNEEGDCSALTSNIANDYVWWNNLLQAQNALGIGAGAYYWLSSNGLGGAYAGEDLLISGYTPNTFGQIYINAHS